MLAVARVMLVPAVILRMLMVLVSMTISMGGCIAVMMPVMPGMSVMVPLVQWVMSTEPVRLGMPHHRLVQRSLGMGSLG